MNKRICTLRYAGILSSLFLMTQGVFGQGYGDPLTMQGVDHATLQSAASRAAGGITIGVRNDVGVMFMNPASLQSLEGIQFSIGGVSQFDKISQVQQYAPLKYYSNFSLLMEGLTGYIPYIPDSLYGQDPGDTVQRPFDNIGPNWSRSKNQGLPIQALIAVPFSINDSKFTIGAGYVEYANLNNYYQNNNVLSPSIGADRPVPIELPASNDTPVVTNWYSYQRSREGSIRGYGIALSGSLSDRIFLGISGMVLRGGTDDNELLLSRGRLTFYRDTYFRIDSVHGRSAVVGTSDFKGTELTFSGIYHGRYVSVGFAVKPPMTITRTYMQNTSLDTSGFSGVNLINGEDKIKLPWRGTVGLSLAPSERLTFGLEYEIRSFASAAYTAADGSTYNPWVSASQVHIGGEYRFAPWLAFRGGIRGQTEIFEQAGNPIVGDPVSSTIYSVGFGMSFGNIRYNIAYEYSPMKYQDSWQTNVNINKNTRHSIMVDLSYEIPRME